MSAKKLKRYTDLTDVNIGTNPSPAYIEIEERGNGINHQTVLTLTDLPISVGNTTGASFGAVKIYEFPQKLIDAVCLLDSLSIGLGSDGNATPIEATDGGDVAIGTSATADATLSGAEVNLIASTSIDPLSGGASDEYTSARVIIDGLASKPSVYINILIDDADVADGADDELLLTATVILNWNILS